MTRTTLTIPEDLREQAKALDINISEVARYALESAIASTKAAREAGAQFETITFTLEHEDGHKEVVQFVGQEVSRSLADEVWLVTPKGGIVYIEWPYFPHLREESTFAVFDDIENFRKDIQRLFDHDGVLHTALQAVEAVLGRTPTPRMLDI